MSEAESGDPKGPRESLQENLYRVSVGPASNVIAGTAQRQSEF
jgi:hypothetical protein